MKKYVCYNGWQNQEKKSCNTKGGIEGLRKKEFKIHKYIISGKISDLYFFFTFLYFQNFIYLFINFNIYLFLRERERH